MTAPEDDAEYIALVSERRELANVRDMAMGVLRRTYDRIDANDGTEADLLKPIEDVETACDSVIAFDRDHPGIRTSSNAEDDEQVMDALRRWASEWPGLPNANI
jgi:hypothetical protein